MNIGQPWMHSRKLFGKKDGYHCIKVYMCVCLVLYSILKTQIGNIQIGLGPSLLGVSHSLVMFPLYEKLKLVLYGMYIYYIEQE